MSEAANESKEPVDKGEPPFDRVRHEMERWLEMARATGERALETLGVVPSGRSSQPAIDVVELEGEVVVLVDLPGVGAENVSVSLVGNMLTVKANRQGLDVPETVRRHIFERTTTQFERAIALPASVDPDAVRAETRDGLLTITLKKPATHVGRSIPVMRAAGASKVEPS